MTATIDVENIHFAYRQGHPILEDISFALDAGTFLAVAGPNGAGKSTLVNLIARLLVPQSGTVRIEGTDIRSYRSKELASKIAVVRPEFVPIFGFSVAETVVMARTAHYDQYGFARQTDREQAMEALELTDTARFASRPLASLSAGERQRVFIARALAQDTAILLMDEPTSFLDLQHQVRIYDLLKTVQREKSRTIIAVTHDINLAAQYCDQALLFYRRPGLPADLTDERTVARGQQYHIGQTRAVFTMESVGAAFGVRVFSGAVGEERFFIPLGAMAKDAAQAYGHGRQQAKSP